MIREDVTRFVASAEVADDCRVDVELRKRRMSLTPTQAHALAGELTRAAEEAEGHLAEIVRLAPLSGFDAAMCGAQGQHQYLCTLAAGHDGWHEAFVDGARVATWGVWA